MTTVVIFDAFGTLLEIKNRRNPYLQILREGRRQGRRSCADDTYQLMTQSLDLQQAADYFGIKLPPDVLQRAERDLEEELASISPLPDALQAVALLQDAGIAMGVCSNLAQPYGSAIHRLFPDMDAYGFSFQIGAMKPEPLIYRATCELLGVRPSCGLDGQGRVIMIGDSVRCDRDGPRTVGMMGFHLERSGHRGMANLVDFANLVLHQMEIASADLGVHDKSRSA